MAVKSPPMYSLALLGEGSRLKTVELTLCLKLVSAPVVALNAARWLRATSWVPGAAPGGRTLVKDPPM
jgi:hypothetical protein